MSYPVFKDGEKQVLFGKVSDLKDTKDYVSFVVDGVRIYFHDKEKSAMASRVRKARVRNGAVLAVLCFVHEEEGKDPTANGVDFRYPKSTITVRRGEDKENTIIVGMAIRPYFNEETNVFSCAVPIDVYNKDSGTETRWVDVYFNAKFDENLPGRAKRYIEEKTYVAINTSGIRTRVSDKNGKTYYNAYANGFQVVRD